MTQAYSPRGVPLSPDPSALRGRALTSIARACLFSAKNVGQTPSRHHFSDDKDLELVSRAATTPTTIANASDLAQITIAFVRSLFAVSAAARVIDRSLQLSFDGAAQINVPNLTLPSASWVGEGHSVAVAQGVTSSGALLPFKLAIIISLTQEMINSSNAEPMMRQLLLDNIGPSLDAAMFGTTAGTAGVQPAGILNGITPLTASTMTGAYDAMIADIGAIGQALGPVSGASPLIIVAAPGQALSMKLFSDESSLEVYSSNALAAGTVVGIVPAGIASNIAIPEITSSFEAEVQMLNPVSGDDPAAGGGPVASVYQSDRIALRLIQGATWVRRSPSAVAVINSVKW
jgi:hypothetical protein